jgi:hypothetical protein
MRRKVTNTHICRLFNFIQKKYMKIWKINASHFTQCASDEAHTKCQWNEVSDDLCYNGDCRCSHHEAQHI